MFVGCGGWDVFLKGWVLFLLLDWEGDVFYILYKYKWIVVDGDYDMGGDIWVFVLVF